jgi:uncharacterized protein involved in type VI secretion and phage assembly
MPDGAKYYGKYRATVTDNADPLKIGRIKAVVPDVAALLPTTWAMPCVPVASAGWGVSVVPQVSAGVWIEFEQGDPNHPIWVGGFWGSENEVPQPPQTPPPDHPPILLQTRNGNRVVITDAAGPDGGVVLASPGGASIKVNDTGIYIDNGKGAKIVLTGPSVSVNDGALAVT